MPASLQNILQDSRFQKPKGLKTHRFYQSQTGHWITYGCIKNPQAKANLVILPGLSEFIEKYYETIQNFYDRGFSVWVIDWHYQGRSGRLSGAPHKRHSDGFETDIADLRYLIHNYIADNVLPLVFVGHSTGGNLALRYMSQYPDNINAALLTSPLLKIYDVRKIPDIALKALSHILIPWHTCFVTGGSNWRASERPSDGSSKFSSDPARDQIHNAWCLEDPILQVGSPTFGWVHHALRAIDFLHKDTAIQAITTPCLFASASDDTIVDYHTTERYAQSLKYSEHILLQGCQHELFMESDNARNHIFESFEKFLKTNIYNN